MGPISYIIFKNTATNQFDALNGVTARIDYSSIDASSVLIYALQNASLLSTGIYAIFLLGYIPINTQILPPKNDLEFFGLGIDRTVIDFGNSTNGQLYFDSKSNINIHDVTLKSQNGQPIDRTRFNNCDGINITNVKINGGGKYFTNWALFFNTNNRNINLNNITTINTEDSPVRTYSTDHPNYNITIQNYTNLGNATGNFKFGNGDGIDLWGSQNVILKHINIQNVTSNGIGIYYNAKNIQGQYISISNVGNAPLPNRCHGINLERWNNVDPSFAQFDNVQMKNIFGHGFRLYTKKSPWNTSTGTITDVKLTNLLVNETYWSGFSLDGGIIKNVVLDGFVISNTNQSKTGSPAINLDADQYNNVLIQNGTLVKPFIQSKSIPSGVTMKNIKNFN